MCVGCAHVAMLALPPVLVFCAARCFSIRAALFRSTWSALSGTGTCTVPEGCMEALSHGVFSAPIKGFCRRSPSASHLPLARARSDSAAFSSDVVFGHSAPDPCCLTARGKGIRVRALVHQRIISLGLPFKWDDRSLVRAKRAHPVLQSDRTKKKDRKSACRERV